MWKSMGLFLRKNHILKMLWLSSSSILDWHFYIVCIVKTASKSLRALICSVKFLSPEVDLSFYESTIQPLGNTVVMSEPVFLVATWIC